MLTLASYIGTLSDLGKKFAILKNFGHGAHGDLSYLLYINGNKNFFNFIVTNSILFTQLGIFPDKFY